MRKVREVAAGQREVQQEAEEKGRQVTSGSKEDLDTRQWVLCADTLVLYFASSSPPLPSPLFLLPLLL